MKVTKINERKYLIQPHEKKEFEVTTIDGVCHALQEFGYSMDEVEDGLTCMLNARHNVIHFGVLNKTFMFSERVKL